MAKTTQAAVMLYLSHDKRAALKELAERTGTLQSVLLREAVDDLLLKHAAKPTRGKGVRAK
jgi:predicted DNA-binding protein